MPFEKGRAKTGGKKKGQQNKVTQDAKKAIAKFVDGNSDKLGRWLDEIAAESPKDAFNCFMSVVEYHIPKLQRTEGETKIEVGDKLAAILQDIDGRSAGLPIIEENPQTLDYKDIN